MLEIRCDACDKLLEVPGGLLFSPPDEKKDCKKYHVCINCMSYVYYFLNISNDKISHNRFDAC